ncbi:hypothetical protein HDU89_000914 [Geranomyces variabilis]|nr:hypothetical protein HDU89_000914 [Geranomyces variabilis]
MADWQNGPELAAADGESPAIPEPLPNGVTTTHLQQAHPTPNPNSYNNNVADGSHAVTAPQEPAAGWSTVNAAAAQTTKKRFTPEQTATLRSHFTPEGKLEDHILQDLLAQTGLTEKQIKTWWSRERSSQRKAAMNQGLSTSGTPAGSSPSPVAAVPGNPQPQPTWQANTPAATLQNPLYQYNYGGMPLPGVPGTITTPLPTYPMYNFPPVMPQHDWSSLLASTAISPLGSSLSSFSWAPSSAAPQSTSSTTSFGGVPSAISALPPAPSAQISAFTTGGQPAAQSTYTPASYLTQALHHPPSTASTSTTATGPSAQPPTPDSLSSPHPVPMPTQLPASPPVADEKSAMEGVVITSPQPAAAPTPARSPSPVKIPTVEEEIQLLVNGTGEIADMQAFAKLVSSQTEWENRAKVLAPLNTAADKVLQSFRRQQGLKLVTKLLLQAKDQLEDIAAASVAIVALQILLKMPVSLDELKEVKTGKVVKHFATAAAGDKGLEIHEAAKKVMDSWQALVANASAKESASPTDESQDKANERKRDRDTADQDAAASASSASSKRAKSDDAVKRETLTAADKRKAAAPLTPPAAVADMDIFKSLAHTSLPKIKKVDPKVVEEANKPTAELKATSPTTSESRTATVGTFALPATSTIPSYRKDPSTTTLSSTSASASASASAAPGKRRVRFAEGDKLVSIRIFETDQGGQDEDSFNTVPHMLGNARDFDRQEGKRAFRKDAYRAKAWTPPPLINAPQTYEWGKNSIEDKIQEERERTMLGVAYYSENQIPPSATEPTEPATPPLQPPKSILWDPPAPAPAASALATVAAPVAGGLDLGSITSLLGMLQNNNVQANPQQSLLAALQQPAAAQTPQQQPNIASLLSRLAQQPQLNLASLLGAAAGGATLNAQPNQFQQPGGPQHRPSPPSQQHQNQQHNPHLQQYNQQQQQNFRPNFPAHMQQQQQQQQLNRMHGSPDTTAGPTGNTRSRWGPPPQNANANNNPTPGGFPQQHNAQAPFQQNQQLPHQYHNHQRGASHNNRGGGRGGFGGGMGAAGRPGPYERPQQGVQMAPGSMDRPCNNFVATGMCRWGDRCAFRHDVKQ